MLFFKRHNRSSTRSQFEPRRVQRQTPLAGQNRTFSYHSARSHSDYNLGREVVQDKPIRRSSTRLRALKRHPWWFVASLLVFAAVVYELQLSSVPKIVPISTSSDAPFLRDTSVYQQEATKLFSGSATNSNKLTVNASAITADFQQQFPELKDVSIALPIIGHQPVIYIQPASPAVILLTPGGSFVVDENGRALIAVTPSMNLAHFHVPTLTDQSNLRVREGKQALASSTATFIQLITQQLQTQHLSVSSLTLPPSAGELDVAIVGKPYIIKFNLNDTQPDAAQSQVGAYIALEGKHIPATEYVDVRLQGRVFYK